MKNIPDLKYSNLLPNIWKKLGETPRTGWVMREVKNPENVQEHIIALRVLAFSFFDELSDWGDEERNDLLDLLEVHDFAEAIVGDEVILEENPEEKKKLKELKFIKEYEAMVEITQPLGKEGENILNLWLRFENGEDRVVKFGRMLDKYQAIEKAYEYEKTQGIALFKEFRDYSLKDIAHPLILKRLERLNSLV